MRCISGRCAMILGMFAAAGAASAGTIVSVTGIPSYPYSVDSLNYLATSWTETQSYTDVSVTAGLEGDGTGKAYLMTAIGPGTTSASEIDSVTITFPGSFENMTLFSGLTLGPGTYYLVLSGDTESQSSGWAPTYSPTITTDVGVTRSIGYYYTDAAPVPYPPSGVYTYFPYDNNGLPLFDVSGTTTPEPRAGLLVGLGFGLMFLRMRRKATIL